MDDDGGIETLARHRRRTAELAARDLHVVGLQCRDYIVHRQTVVRQLIRIVPDPHGVFAAESFHLPNTRHPRQHLLYNGKSIVSQVNVTHAAVFGNQTQNHQVVCGGFSYSYAPLLYRQRQSRHRQL